MEKKYEGKCHCGAVNFGVDADIERCFKCNCSFCARRASTLVKVDNSHFYLKSGEAQIENYGSRDFADHYFCKTCGIHCYTKFHTAKGAGVNVNVGCLEGVDVFSLNPALFDGANKL